MKSAATCILNVIVMFLLHQFGQTAFSIAKEKHFDKLRKVLQDAERCHGQRNLVWLPQR